MGFRRSFSRHYPSILPILLSLMAVPNLALYEDQIGKFDWRLQNVGRIRHALIDVSSKQVLLASNENVVASLALNTGKLGWRHVMEDSAVINAMFECTAGSVTVSTRHVRRWDSSSGMLVWETALGQSLQPGDKYVILDEQFVVLGPVRIMALSMKTGVQMWSIDAPWKESDSVFASVKDETILACVVRRGETIIWTVQDEILSKPAILPAVPLLTDETRCALDGSLLVCVSPIRSTVNTMDTLLKSPTMQSSTLNAQWEPKSDMSSDDIIITDEHLIIQGLSNGDVFNIKNNMLQTKFTYSGAGAVTIDPDNEEVVIVSVTHITDTTYKVSAKRLEDGANVEHYSQTVTSSVSALPVKIVPYITKKTSIVYRLLVVFEDDTVALIHQTGKMSWIREEGLSTLAAVEFVDLPVSEVEAQMEEEFGSKAGNIFTMFFGRLITQTSQVYSFLLHSYHKYVTGLRVVAETEDHMAMDEDYLTRDDFNLHKMIVAVSKTGKIFGVDSFTGGIVWTHFVSQIKPFTHGESFLLYVQRTTAHFPHQPVATLIGNRKCKGCEGSVAFSFNPISGKPYGKLINLGFQTKQAMFVAEMTSDFMHPLVLLDIDNKVHVYPDNADIEDPQLFYMFTADPEKSSMNGFQLKGSSLKTLKSSETWSVQLGQEKTMISVEIKRAKERVHSLGRVLADRSVLYKYSNPNLLTVVTETKAADDTNSLSVFLIDGISGRILFSCDHKKSVGPVHLVNSENWVVYTYYNDKFKRSEIAVLEMYEGEKQSNATAFSSLETGIRPIVIRQAYVLNMGVSALATTITEKGISGKNILLARTVGGLVEVPKPFLDPRRPLEPTQQSKEEGLVPYMPELPLSFEGTINYNQSVYRIHEIHTDISGLESTSLILAYGLDIFHTRVAPSKMYDVLKDDFDFLFIGAVTFGMIVASVVSRHFALRRMVGKAWK